MGAHGELLNLAELQTCACQGGQQAFRFDPDRNIWTHYLCNNPTRIYLETLTERNRTVMAQQTIVELLDDLDGSEATETVAFALDGRSYEIDLNDENAAKLRDVLAEYVAAARKAGKVPAARNGSSSGTARKVGPDLAAVRAWAEENGLEVSARGRIARSVMEAYLAANGG